MINNNDLQRWADQFIKEQAPDSAVAIRVSDEPSTFGIKVTMDLRFHVASRTEKILLEEAVDAEDMFSYMLEKHFRVLVNHVDVWLTQNQKGVVMKLIPWFRCKCGKLHTANFVGHNTVCKCGETSGRKSRSNQQVRKIQMEFNEYVRKPFVVEAVEVTAENMSEIAKFVGEVREKEDGTPFILVDRRLIPNVFRVYPGYWMTRMGDNIRCYSRKIFLEQFVASHPDIIAWVDFMNAWGVENSRVAQDEIKVEVKE